MIENKKQYEITSQWAQNFRNALDETDFIGPPGFFENIMREALQSELVIMESDLAEYQDRQTCE